MGCFQQYTYYIFDSSYLVLILVEGQAGCSGESCLTESPGRGFEAASLQICGGKACLGFPLPQTSLMWEPPALGLPWVYPFLNICQ